MENLLVKWPSPICRRVPVSNFPCWENGKENRQESCLKWSRSIEFSQIWTMKSTKCWWFQPIPRIFWRLRCHAHCLDNISMIRNSNTTHLINQVDYDQTVSSSSWTGQPVNPMCLVVRPPWSDASDNFQEKTNSKYPAESCWWPWLNTRATVCYWLVVWTPLKKMSQLGWLSPIYGEIKNVPNHQPLYHRYIYIWYM